MACIQSPINSNLTSLSNAPISEMLTYPLMPNVEGKMYEKYFHTAGIDDAGHEIPERKSRGIERNTKSTMYVSRS